MSSLKGRSDTGADSLSKRLGADIKSSITIPHMGEIHQLIPHIDNGCRQSKTVPYIGEARRESLLSITTTTSRYIRVITITSYTSISIYL